MACMRISNIPPACIKCQTHAHIIQSHDTTCNAGCISTGQADLMHMKLKNCTLVQALRLCTGRRAHRWSRGIDLLFLDHGTKRGWEVRFILVQALSLCTGRRAHRGSRDQTGVSGQHHAPAALYPRKRPGTHCRGGWLGPRAGLDRCGKSRPHRDSIPEPSSP